MTEEEILERAFRLTQWMQQSSDARLAVKGTCLSVGCATLGELAQSDEETFNILYEGVHDMMEQLPDYWTP